MLIHQSVVKQSWFDADRRISALMTFLEDPEVVLGLERSQQIRLAGLRRSADVVCPVRAVSERSLSERLADKANKLVASARRGVRERNELVPEVPLHL
jgi:hypothetical protein